MMPRKAYSEVFIQLKRNGGLIEIVATNASVTFRPDDIQKTFNDIVSKCNELDPENPVSYTDRRDIDTQLTEIYKEYEEERLKRRIREADHLVYLARSHIKEQFKDQTSAYYVVVEKDGRNQLFKTNSAEFEIYLSRLYYDTATDSKVINRNTINSAKRVIESFTDKETRTLYNRIAKICDTIYYNLNNEESQCVKISKDGWEIIDCPMIFSKNDISRKQEQPKLPIEESDSEK